MPHCLDIEPNGNLDGHSRDQNDIPIPFLHSRALQPFEVDYLLLECIALRWKLGLCRNGPSILADATVPIRGENFAEDVFPSCSCPSEYKCAQSYKQKFASATPGKPQQSVPAAILEVFNLGGLVLETRFRKSSACFIEGW